MDGVNDQLDIQTSTLSPDRRLLVVRGDVEFRTAPLLRAAIDTAREGTGCHVTIDLAAVAFIDSSGLAVLIDANTQAPVTLRRPSPAVTRVIDVTGLSSTLAIEPA
jgi:anti-anti-sigma factor